jgi:S-adenosylmethionine synthetase
LSKIKADHVFTSESVSEGHPDKICDQISDAILDACLAADPKSRVACETVVADGLVVNVGEVTCGGWDQINTEKIARRVIKEIGYNRKSLRFWHDSFVYVSRIHEQSPEIAGGVHAGEAKHQGDGNQGAGDQGMMFGYATNETEEFMPAPIAYSHRLLQRLADLRKEKTIPYLRPDAKAQVSVKYVAGKPKHINALVVSHQTKKVDIHEIRRGIEEVVRQVLGPTGLLEPETRYIVNLAGPFTLGGPYADSGLTGRKPRRRSVLGQGPVEGG